MTATIEQVNSRLKHGQGWIGFRFSKYKGERKQSKTLYYGTYVNGKQKFIKTDSTDPEEAYRQLLSDRERIDGGEHILPTDTAKLRYEDLREILMRHYRNTGSTAIYTRKRDKVETFHGATGLDPFFKRMPVSQITSVKISEFIDARRKAGDADGTIKRTLGTLRSAFHQAEKLDLVARVPNFPMPKEGAPRENFVDVEKFVQLRDAMPENLRLAVSFLYWSGFRSGAAKKITWAMVSKDCTMLNVDRQIMKTKKPWSIPLVGPLAEIAEALRAIRKNQIVREDSPVFDFQNFGRVWNRTCHDLGLGVYSKTRTTENYTGLRPHDFRRSAARNLRNAGVSEDVCMRITGHKTSAIFKRYAILTNEDVTAAMLKVGQLKKADVVPFVASK